VTSRKAKYALLLIGVSVLFLAATSEATPNPGITVTVFNNRGFNNAPPLPPTTPIVGTTQVAQVDQNFDRQPLFNMYEDFVVRYDSYLTAPCTCDVRFMTQADDGTVLYLDNTLVTYDWFDKGGGGTVSEPVSFEYGVPKQMLLWYYENGGAAWVKLYWMLDETWEIIPASAFSTVEVWTTTTTMNTLPPTTEPSTTSSLILSSTTTTLPDPPTTTSTSLQPTTTPPSSTIPVSLSPSTESSSSTSLPRQIPTSTLSSTTTLTTILGSTSTTVSEASLSVPTTTETTTSTSIAPTQETTNQNGKTYTRKVGIGPIQITLTATEEQRRTVVAVAIVQIAAVATISATGVSTTSSTTNGRRR